LRRSGNDELPIPLPPPPPKLAPLLLCPPPKTPQGDQAHAGFPEAAYSSMAEQLARAGYRVVVVEQVGGAQL
jgi:hypothetical protein